MRPLAAGLLSLALAACTSVAPTVPRDAPAARTDDVPAAIAVPSGSRLAVTLKAAGLQNYECRAKPGTSGDFAWTFVSPEAALKDDSDKLVGRHYGGPSWEHGDGSKVTGTVLATAPASMVGDIPWLLLKGDASGSGVLAGVTYVQRLHTNGGVAPSDPCGAPTIGTRKAVRYTADYLFYRG